MARIYTRTGDRGETGLFDGSRTSKADRRVDLYGEVDELNSTVGMVCAELEHQGLVPGELTRLFEDLRNIQSDLFVLGGLRADPGRCEKLREAGPAVRRRS